MNIYEVENSITAPEGFLASGIHCGLKKKKKDLALIYSEVVSYTHLDVYKRQILMKLWRKFVLPVTLI